MAGSKYAAVRVVFRPVTDDLAGNRKILHAEESIELVEFEGEAHNGDIVRIHGRTEDGMDVIVSTPESAQRSVRAREGGGPYSSLGCVERIEGVCA